MRPWMALWLLPVVLLLAVACEEEEHDVGTPTATMQVEATENGHQEAPEPTVEAAAEGVEPTPAREPTEETVGRIVPAAPGAVAEAEGVLITLNDIVDPWVSPADFAPDEPDPGMRFVAFDVTIQYVAGSGTESACPFGFKLTDADDFAYDVALLFDLKPRLDCVDLGSGQKTRGWIGFEVAEGTPLQLLKYDPDPFTTQDIEFQFREPVEAAPAAEPTSGKAQRIVPAAPGAVAEAEGVLITLNEIVDPWVSPAGLAPDRPDPGMRFVAFDVTMQYVRERGTHFACGFGFKLSDADDFAYEVALLIDLKPGLDCVDLGSGQKTRGWIGFEVNEGTPLKLLRYDPDPFTTDDIEFEFR